MGTAILLPQRRADSLKDPVSSPSWYDLWPLMLHLWGQISPFFYMVLWRLLRMREIKWLNHIAQPLIPNVLLDTKQIVTVIISSERAVISFIHTETYERNSLFLLPASPTWLSSSVQIPWLSSYFRLCHSHYFLEIFLKMNEEFDGGPLVLWGFPWHLNPDFVAIVCSGDLRHSHFWKSQIHQLLDFLTVPRREKREESRDMLHRPREVKWLIWMLTVAAAESPVRSTQSHKSLLPWSVTDHA